MVSGEPDFTKRMKGMMDLWWIKGVLLQDPTIAACLPTSIENPAIAYDESNDRFKVDIAAMSVGTIDANVTDRAARLLGVVYGSVDQLQQRASTKELIVQIQHQGAEKNPESRNWTITENLARSWSLGNSDIPDLSNRSNRLLGVVYGSKASPLLQRDTTFDLMVQLRSAGVQIDPRDISDRTARILGVILGSQAWPLQQRATSRCLMVQLRHLGDEIDPRDVTDRAARLVGKVYGNEDVLQQRATSKELKVQIQHQGSEKDPTQIRALTSSDVVTVADVAKTATAVQIDETYGAAGNATIHAPDGTNKVRLKLISLELDSDVDLGFRWTTEGDIYYLRKTAGVIVTNFIGCNPEGGAGEDLELYASGACDVNGYCLLEEIV